jgi:hypothetical protein
MQGIYEVGFEVASCGTTYIPSFMKIGTGVEVIILRFCLLNWRGCNAAHTGFHKDLLRHSKVKRVGGVQM